MDWWWTREFARVGGTLADRQTRGKEHFLTLPTNFGWFLWPWPHVLQRKWHYLRSGVVIKKKKEGRGNPPYGPAALVGDRLGCHGAHRWTHPLTGPLRCWRDINLTKVTPPALFLLSKGLEWTNPCEGWHRFVPDWRTTASVCMLIDLSSFLQEGRVRSNELTAAARKIRSVILNKQL